VLPRVRGSEQGHSVGDGVLGVASASLSFVSAVAIYSVYESVHEGVVRAIEGIVDGGGHGSMIQSSMHRVVSSRGIVR
jgi:hypothetical protein